MRPYQKILLPGLIMLSVAAVTLICWWGYESPAIGMDDANIYFVYMKNLALGNGFVWNTGGERVEGFTSLLWTLIGALCYKLSPQQLPALLFCISAILTFFTIYSILLFSRKLNHTEDKPITFSDIIILTLLLSSLGFVEWHILSLMETSAWTFLLVHITLQLCNFYFNGKKINVWRFALLLILLNLTRPESALFNVLFILILVAILYNGYGKRYALRKSVIPVLAHMATVAAVTSWRLSYFGYPLPNTFYAKISFNVKDNIIGGLQYLLTFFYSYPHAAFVTVILFFFAIFLLLKLKNKNTRTSFTNEERAQAIVLTVVAFALALPVITGGDHFKYSRFYQPALPLMYLSVTHQYFWKHYFRFSIERNTMTTTFLVISLVFAMFFFSKSTLFDFKAAKNNVVHYRIIQDFKIAREGREIAQKLNETFAAAKEYPSIGTVAAGGVGYVYKGTTIDLLGLNNTIMAHATTVKSGFRNHASFDRRGFWLLRPDMMGTFSGAEIVEDTAAFILPENTEEFRSSDFVYLCYKGIFDDRAFREVYFPALVKNKNKNYFVFDYYKKSFLQSLDSTTYVVIHLDRKYNPDLNRFSQSL